MDTLTKVTTHQGNIPQQTNENSDFPDGSISQISTDIFQKHYSPSTNKSLKKLERSFNLQLPSEWIKLFYSIWNIIKGIFIIRILSKRHNELLFNQEHLVNHHQGALPFVHKKIFLKILKRKCQEIEKEKKKLEQEIQAIDAMKMDYECVFREKDLDASLRKLHAKLAATENKLKEFIGLRQGVKRMQLAEVSYAKGLTDSGRTQLARRMHDQANALLPGEDMWLDLSSAPSGHSMKGRLIRNLDQDGKKSFTFQFSNTGAGVDKSPAHFHHTTPHGEELYQTVAEWSNLSEDIFTPSFFKNLVDATILGRPKKIAKEEDFYEHGENLDAIQALYDVFGVFGEPVKSEDSRYLSRAQLGPSCVPSSMWAMTKVVLSKECFEELHIDSKIRFLQKNFCRMMKGKESDTTLKIMILDDAYYLAGLIRSTGRKVPEIFDKIIKKLSEESGVGQGAVKLVPPKKNLLVQQDEQMKLHVKKAKFSPDLYRLRAHVTFEPNTFLSVTAGNISNSNDLTAILAQLYYEVATGSKENLSVCLERCFKLFKQKPEDINIDSEQLFKMITLLTELVHDLSRFDHTLPGIMQQYALNLLIKDLLLVLVSQNGSIEGLPQLVARSARIFSHVADRYQTLNVGQALAGENLWAKKISRLTKPQWKWVAAGKQLQAINPESRVIQIRHSYEPFQNTDLNVTLKKANYQETEKQGVAELTFEDVVVDGKPLQATFKYHGPYASADNLADAAYAFYYHAALGDDALAQKYFDLCFKKCQNSTNNLDDIKKLTVVMQNLLDLNKQWFNFQQNNKEALARQQDVAYLVRNLYIKFSSHLDFDSNDSKMRQIYTDIQLQIDQYESLALVTFFEDPLESPWMRKMPSLNNAELVLAWEARAPA